MKLKSLNKRAHNIMFHTHTVAGIVISFALFVIFYAGAVALFKNEIYKWENPNARFETPDTVNFENAIKSIEKSHPSFKKEDQLTFVLPNESIPFIQVYGSVLETDSTTSRFHALVNPVDFDVVKSEEPLTTVGDTMYHLHFFDQIPALGIWISGLVSIFFLFAIVTGVLVHWKNLVTKFYGFTAKGKWKQIWTNAHTVLGVIGLPFQVVYAITGAFFGLLTLLLAPSVIFLFDGDSTAIFENIRPDRTLEIDVNAPASDHKTIDELLLDVQANYSDFTVRNVVTLNYGRVDAMATFAVDDGEGIIGDGLFVYSMKTGELVKQIVPNKKTYSQTIYNLLTKLHFATFGGILLKIIYFILSMITCFIILSGILIWKKARDNSKYTDKQKRFHHRTTKVYLAICLSLFPATALIFLANKLVPIETIGRIHIVNTVFFGGWLLLILVGLFWNDFEKLNKNYLLIGGVLALLIPATNGVVTGDWIWKALANKQYHIFSVDIVWLCTGIIGILISLFYLKSKKVTSLNYKRLG